MATCLQVTSAYMHRTLNYCTTNHYFAVLYVSAREEAAHLRDVTGSRQTLLSVLWNLLPFNRQPEVSREQVLDQLRVRMSVLKKLFQQLEVRAWPLKDASLLQTFASCLALGADIPSFQPELQDEVTAEALIQLAEQHEPGAATGEGMDRRAPFHQQQNASSQPAGNHRTRKHAARLYRKRLRGLHGNVTYLSRIQQARF